MDVFVDENDERKAVTYAPDFWGNYGLSYKIRDLKAAINYSGDLVSSK